MTTPTTSLYAENGRSENHEIAAAYLRRGLAVIPVPPGSKNPGRLGWQNERHKPEDAARLWRGGENIGALLGEPSGGIVDVDLDRAEAQVVALYLLPPTCMSRRKGHPVSHMWYRADPIPATTKYKLPGQGDDRTVVELRSTGAQTLVPPSVHPSGESIKWNGEKIAEINGDELLEHVADVATAALLLQHYPGQGTPHDYALAASGYLARHLGRGRVERIMGAVIRASGDEEARSREHDVTDTLESVAAGKPTTGGPTLEQLAPGVVEQLVRWHGFGWAGQSGAVEAGAVHAPTLQTFTARDLMAEELQPVRWAVPGLIPEGVSLFAGKPKMGKSWMALGLGVAVVTGGVALGKVRVEPGEVLYLALEDHKRRLQKRLRKLLQGREVPEKLHITTEVPRLGQGGADALAGWLAEHPGCRLVVVDTLARLRIRATGRRSQYDEDREAVDPLVPIAAEHNVAIVLVHHLREAESDDPLDMIHGSAGLTGGVDGALVLKRKRGDADAYLHVDGRDIENPTELALKFEQSAATWTIMGEAEEYRKSETRRAIMKVLEEADEPLGPKDVADVLDLKENTVRQRLYHMSNAGDVRVVSRGLYALHNNRNDRNSSPGDVTGVTVITAPHNEETNGGNGDDEEW